MPSFQKERKQSNFKTEHWFLQPFKKYACSMAKSTQLGSLGEIQLHGPTMVMVRGVIMGKSREKFFDGNSDENFPMRNVN